MSQTNEKLKQELLIAQARLNVSERKLQLVKSDAHLVDKRTDEFERANEYLRGVLGNRGP